MRCFKILSYRVHPVRIPIHHLNIRRFERFHYRLFSTSGSAEDCTQTGKQVNETHQCFSGDGLTLLVTRRDTVESGRVEYVDCDTLKHRPMSSHRSEACILLARCFWKYYSSYWNELIARRVTWRVQPRFDPRDRGKKCWFRTARRIVNEHVPLWFRSQGKDFEDVWQTIHLHYSSPYWHFAYRHLCSKF